MTNDWGLDLLVPRRASGPTRASNPPRPLLLPRLHSRSALLKHPKDSAEDLPDEVPEDVARALGHGHEYQRRTYPYGLRPTLLFPLPVYPFAILVDLILRLTWSAKLSSHLHSYSEGDLIIFWIELAEVVRRWMWVFLRVEWETVKEARETRSPPPEASVSSIAPGSDAGNVTATERREPYREPIFEHEEFELVPSDFAAHVHTTEVG